MVVTTTKPELIPAVRALRKTRTAEADKAYATMVGKLAAGEFLHPEDVLQCLDDSGRTEDELQAAITRLQNRAKWQADLEVEAGLQADLKRLEAESVKARAEYDALFAAFKAKGQVRFEKIQNLNARLSAFDAIRAKLRESAPTDEAERLADLGAQLAALNVKVQAAVDYLDEHKTKIVSADGFTRPTLHTKRLQAVAAIERIKERGPAAAPGDAVELPNLEKSLAAFDRERTEAEAALLALRSQREAVQRELTAADAAAMKA